MVSMYYLSINYHAMSHGVRCYKAGVDIFCIIVLRKPHETNEAHLVGEIVPDRPFHDFFHT